tara:strand:- start:6638 stop:7297 length:660 start_codon:yes stop_codon:yes gene_type:complete
MKKKLNVLVLSPHADDAEIGMGGTIAKLVKQKNNVTILTAILPKENLSGQVDEYMENKRYQEQLNSSKLLGANLQTLNLDPYDFKFNREYVKIFDEKVKSIKPDVIFSCWEHDTHQDHKTLAKIIFSVSRKNNVSLYMYEAMLPGGINTNAFNPQLFVDISNFMKTKIRSINCYKSVFQRKKNNYSNFMESITARAKFRGEMIGVKYAECFVVVKKIEL